MVGTLLLLGALLIDILSFGQDVYVHDCNIRHLAISLEYRALTLLVDQLRPSLATHIRLRRLGLMIFLANEISILSILE